MDVPGINGDSGVSQMNQQQLLMDYLAAMNGGGGVQPVADNQMMQDSLLEGIMQNSNGNSSGGDGFPGGALNPAVLMQNFNPNFNMPVMNSAFHKEFFKQIANVQKEQSNGTLGMPMKRPVGRPPSNGVSRSGVNGTPGTTPNKPTRESGGSPRFPCDYCHKTFASRYYLATHIQVHLAQLSPEERKEQLRIISSPEQLRLLERVQQKQQMLQGGKPSGNNVVEGERPTFHCQKCNKVYRYEGAFESHRCAGRNGECGRSFRNRSILCCFLLLWLIKGQLEATNGGIDGWVGAMHFAGGGLLWELLSVDGVETVPKRIIKYSSENDSRCEESMFNKSGVGGFIFSTPLWNGMEERFKFIIEKVS